MTHTQRRERRSHIASGIAGGMTVREAAEQYGLSLKWIGRACKENGVTAPRVECIRVSRKPIDTTRRDAMHAMKEAGQTLAQIGTIYGLTRERVRQLIAATGIPVKLNRLIAQDVCMRSGVSIGSIHFFIASGDLVPMERTRKAHFFSEQEIVRFTEWIRTPKNCKSCGRPMTGCHRTRNRCFECAADYRKTRSARLRIGEIRPMNQRRVNAARAAIAALNGSPRTFVRLISASKASGLSSMQIYWLAFNRVITTQPTDRLAGPKRVPMKLYCFEEVIAAAEAYRNYRPAKRS